LAIFLKRPQRIGHLSPFLPPSGHAAAPVPPFVQC